LPCLHRRRSPSTSSIDPNRITDRGDLADCVGRAGFELRPVFDALLADLKRSSKLFMHETRAPVLIPVCPQNQDRLFLGVGP